MAPETAFHTMIPDTKASCAMDIGKRSLLQDTTVAWADFTRPNGLHEAAKWEMYQRSNRRECVANYLTVIDTEG